MLEPLWDQAGKGAFNLATSELTIAEVLVKPIKEDNRALEKIYRELFEATEIKLIPTTRRIWNEMATLRARTNLRTPDAVHASNSFARRLCHVHHQRHRLPKGRRTRRHRSSRSATSSVVPPKKAWPKHIINRCRTEATPPPPIGQPSSRNTRNVREMQTEFCPSH